MWNKLLRNRRYILAPLLTGLREINRKADANHAEISALNREISELAEQNVIINQLRAKGYLDAALFTQQNDEISGKLDALRAQRRNLLRQDDDDPILAEIQTLDEIMEIAEPLTTFVKDAFGLIVNRITIENEKLRFHLLGGLELSEYLSEKGGHAR